MDFKDLFKKTREDNKLSIEELSQKVSISESSLLKFEDGTSLPCITDLVKICKALNVTPNDLLLGVTFQQAHKKIYLQHCGVSHANARKLEKEEKIKYVKGLKENGELVNTALLQRKLGIHYCEAKELIEIVKSMGC
jgi:transcriptional regulator with XRE-family HTH domain